MTPFAQAIICSIAGLISLILLHFIVLPQLIDFIKTKNSSGTSLITYIIYVLNCYFWCIWSYGFYFNNMLKPIPEGLTPALYALQFLPAVVSNTLNPILMTFLLFLKIWHLRMSKKLNVTEIELASILKNKSRYLFDKNLFKRNLPSILLLIFSIVVEIATFLLVWLLIKPKAIIGANDWAWVGVINFFCGATNEMISWPLFIKSLRKKETSGVSLFWSIFIPVSAVVFFTYDLLMAFANGWSFNVIFALILGGYIPSFGVLIIKVRNLHNAKKMNMTEEEYSKKVLIPMAEKKNIKK